MTTSKKLAEYEYENVVVFDGVYTYDTALVGVTDDNRAIYDYDKMAEWLASFEGVDVLTATELLDHELLYCLQEIGPGGPIIMHPIACSVV